MQVPTIPLSSIAIMFVPVAVVLWMMYRWSMGVGNASYALVRMLAQLLIIGYVLAFIFNSDNAGLVLLVLFIMILAASWIALGPVKQHRRKLLNPVLFSTVVSCVVILAIVTQLILKLDPWFDPRYMIPLGGMLFANAMNTNSLVLERLYAEYQHGLDFEPAKKIAFQAAMIPNVNALFAVGLVSLPGMMTGQILAGVSPLIAVRYQIVVMCMLFASAGISACCLLITGKRVLIKTE